MNCPSCQTENPEGAKFCMGCGEKLQNQCPQCSTELPSGAKFCLNCGHKLDAASKPATPVPAPTAPIQAAAPPLPAAEAGYAASASLERFVPKELLNKLQSARTTGTMVGERRIVTMLFCDVKGSTAAAGQLDPEEWAEIINGAFEYMIQPVYKYEGTLARLMGDAILAFFGAPIAHEDDPQRAILAGLEIVEDIKQYRRRISQEWGIDLDVRVGINTGLVVVGAVGSDLRMEYSALGDAINLAARMEQTAQPGTIHVAETTYKLVAPLFDFKFLGHSEIKGKEEPVPTYRALGVKEQPGQLRGIAGLDSPVVGRQSEMDTLHDALHDLEQGRGSIVSLIADAGLGKSRLVAEVRHGHADAAHADRYWLEGRSLSYETSTPYAPFVELFTSCFGLEAAQSPAEKYSRIKSRIDRSAPGSGAELAPFIAALMDVQPVGADADRIRFMEPPTLGQGIVGAVVAYLEALALSRPLVLVFDDIHWIDPSSLALLEAIMPLTDRAPILLIALFRPQRQEPSWHFHEIASRDFGHRYRSLFLQPLSPDDARQLVANLLHVEDLPEKVRLLILEKAEGNPFFVEEVIRSLLDAGLIVHRDGHWHATQEIAQISVPDTLAAVITTRLDRLDEEMRQLLQTASVIGRQFNYGLLAAIHSNQTDFEHILTELQRRELIREKARLPERIYIFKHALTQETAYNALLLRTRREVHLRVAGVLERTTPNAVTDLAHHYMAARQPERALPYLVAAGDRAAKSYASQEAIRFYEQALDALQQSPNPALSRQTLEGLGNILSFVNDLPGSITAYQDLLALGEQVGDVPMQVSALNKLSFLFALRLGDFQQGNDFLLDADRRARAHEDKAGLSEMGLIRCMMCTAAADFDGVIRYMDETVSLGQELGVKEQMTMGYAHIASSQAYLLDFDRAAQTLAEGLALCREIGDRLHEGEMLAGTGALCRIVQGDLAGARSSALAGVAIADQIGDLQGAVHGHHALGQLDLLEGDYEGAIDHFQRYLDLSRTVGMAFLEAEALCLIGTVYLDISTALLDRVFGFHTKAVEVLEMPGGSMMGATAWGELGFCLRAAGKLEKAVTLFEQGLTTPTITGNLERGRLLVGMALTTLDLGDEAGAQAYVEQAEHYVDDHGLRHHAPLVSYALGCIDEEQGRLDEALAHFALAEKQAATMGMRPVVWQAQAGEARILQQCGQAAAEQIKEQAARQTVQEIGAQFQDPDLRDAFLVYAQDRIAGSHTSARA